MWILFFILIRASRPRALLLKRYHANNLHIVASKKDNGNINTFYCYICVLNSFGCHLCTWVLMQNQLRSTFQTDLKAKKKLSLMNIKSFCQQTRLCFLSTYQFHTNHELSEHLHVTLSFSPSSSSLLLLLLSPSELGIGAQKLQLYLHKLFDKRGFCHGLWHTWSSRVHPAPSV